MSGLGTGNIENMECRLNRVRFGLSVKGGWLMVSDCDLSFDVLKSIEPVLFFWTKIPFF